jgi:hypothetical protein
VKPEEPEQDLPIPPELRVARKRIDKVGQPTSITAPDGDTDRQTGAQAAPAASPATNVYGTEAAAEDYADLAQSPVTGAPG